MAYSKLIILLILLLFQQESENSSTAIDNIFLDISKHDNYKVQPQHNGLLDHKAEGCK